MLPGSLFISCGNNQILCYDYQVRCIGTVKGNDKLNFNPLRTLNIPISQFSHSCLDGALKMDIEFPQQFHLVTFCSQTFFDYHSLE